MELEKAFKRLLIKSPFYGLFCLSLPKEITKSVSTLAVTKEGISCKLNVNPDFWETLTDNEQLALLQHELGHICLQHMFMSESFSDAKLFNIAADAEINSYIDNLPEGGVTAKALSALLGFPVENGEGTKYYYELLNSQSPQKNQANNPQKPCNGGQGGQSSSPSSEAAQDNNSQYPEAFNGMKSFDDHSSWKDFKDLPETTRQLISNNINAVMKQTAEQVEKMRGTIPGELTEIIAKLKAKRPEVFNWKAYFRRMLGSIYDVNIRSTRRKESKRFEGAAGVQHRKKVSILVAVDTSGSVSSKELQDFFVEIDYIFKAGARVTILECDTKINKIVEYDGKTVPEIKGRGGTEFDPPIDYYIKYKKEYASLIYFTDGYSELPKHNPSGLVWVITSTGCVQDYPGKAIYIPKPND